MRLIRYNNRYNKKERSSGSLLFIVLLTRAARNCRLTSVASVKRSFAVVFILDAIFLFAEIGNVVWLNSVEDASVSKDTDRCHGRFKMRDRNNSECVYEKSCQSR